MTRCIAKLFILPLSLLILSGCEEERKAPKQPLALDTVVVKPKEIEIKYYFYPVEGIRTLTKLKEEFGSGGKKIILALNRLDSRNITRGDSLVVPDTIYDNIMPYSPFPKRVELLSRVKKLLIFSYSLQAFAAYEKGNLIRWGPTSLGKRSTPTPTGLLHTNWKSKSTISTIDSTWILPWAFNIDNFDGVSIHQFDLPGYPASHSCCRLLDTDAEWIYYWAEQWITTSDGEKIVAYGTPVIIYGKYDYKNPRPWKKLVADSKANSLTQADMKDIIEPYIETIIRRAEKRDSVLAARQLNKKK